jgi:hypothetical protein
MDWRTSDKLRKPKEYKHIAQLPVGEVESGWAKDFAKFAILGIQLGDHVHLGLATIASLALMDVYKHSYVQNKAKALAVECAVLEGGGQIFFSPFLGANTKGSPHLTQIPASPTTAPA